MAEIILNCIEYYILGWLMACPKVLKENWKTKGDRYFLFNENAAFSIINFCSVFFYFFIFFVKHGYVKTGLKIVALLTHLTPEINGQKMFIFRDLKLFGTNFCS